MSPRLSAGAALALLLLAGPFSAPSRADNLDVALVEHSKTLFHELHDRRLRNVGILPFQVARGGRKASFAEGSLSMGMVVRMENLLLMAAHRDDKGFRLLWDVPEVAARERVGSWSQNAEALYQLFQVRYPAAHRVEREMPDALLTGSVEYRGEREKARVRIDAIFRDEVVRAHRKEKDFARMSPEKFRVKLAEFSVEVDRSLLAEMGCNFCMPSGVASRVRGRSERDRWVADALGRRGKGEPENWATPEDVAGIAFRILYNGEVQKIRPISSSDRDAGYYVRPIAPGTRVTFEVTRNGKRDEKLGVVIRVNGKSTWEKEEGDPCRLHRWIYPVAPNRVDVFQGFSTADGKEEELFKVLDEREAAMQPIDLGRRVGLIDVDVFASGTAPADPIVFSTRGKKVGYGSTRDLAGAQEHLLRETGLKRADEGGIAGLIVPGDKVESTPPTSASFPNPVHVGHLTIRYCDPAKLSGP